jgi:serine/threonine-protein kinase
MRDREHELERICQAALEQPMAARAGFLAEACGDDEGLRLEVEALLAREDTAVVFLETPALAVAARVMGADTPALTAGRQIGPYTIVSRLGSGGMGEVYRARDATLRREVAIKVLPTIFTSDPERLARFEREARVLASLNHPNIATIHGIEHVDGIHALILEVVEGETLAERLQAVASSRRTTQAGLSLSDAVTIARQIAEALEAAHEKGIVHRDLKPANIKIRPDGVVKVLDFGLAKAMATDGSAADGSQVPTRTMDGTRAGMILGTAAYMSPEQARGEVVDKRTDIWAFGCVLYEMLAGCAPFAAVSTTETLSEVLKSEPDWQRLPADTPDSVRRLLRRCLAKDRKRRLTDIRDGRLDLDDVPSDVPMDPRLAGHSPSPERLATATAPPVVAQRRRITLTSTAVVLAGAVVAATLTWVVTRQPPPAPPRVSRLTLALSGTAALTVNGGDRDLAITPDGSRIVYVGNRGTQLFVRAFDALEPVAVFTGAVRGPFVSPEGKWIGFVDQAVFLKKVAVTGGPAVMLTRLDGRSAGATWAPDDTVIFATGNVTTGLQRVAAAGETTVLTRPDHAAGEADHLWPELLPGGRAVLFTITAASGGLDAAQVAVLDLQTGTHKIILRGGSHAHYVPSGHLVYAAAGTLRAVTFDPARLETRGTSVRVIPEVVTTSLGSVDAMVADDGTLAYVSWPGVVGATSPRTLVWVDRRGRETPITAEPRAYHLPQLSPDGTRVAVYASDQQQDIWLWDLARTTLTRLTFDPRQDMTPVWTPDGRRLLFSSLRAGPQNLYVQAADGTGSATRLTESDNQQVPTSTARDGSVVFYETTPTRGRDLWRLILGPPPRAEPLLETPFEERGGIVSPDGRWLAYESDSSGRFEIYVRPFPDVGNVESKISPSGGVQPLWAGNGREIFYVAPDGALMTVPVEPRGTTWSAGTATKLVEGRYYTGAGEYFLPQYDVSPDGQRFLMIKEGGAAPSLIVVQNWDQELKRLVPAN